MKRHRKPFRISKCGWGREGYVYRIVPSRYQGYDAVAINSDLFAQIVAGSVIDGIPAPILNLGSRTLADVA